jgi:hypothetical protein
MCRALTWNAGDWNVVRMLRNLQQLRRNTRIPRAGTNLEQAARKNIGVLRLRNQTPLCQKKRLLLQVPLVLDINFNK